ncbi:hypothetical protein BOW53_14045 [Solemya pervernicosa gill symbiont]|uniref:DUF4382 domain-containing protein n=1 Tax=Solemya pervernicosa gill symbiont TaxID=642797 RepID=A0A1T2L168_9GAMM|nr:DUF4382 domain-containing protein [Solemya pervernicosa gill symbiont]OOZ38824.1 hypothetical protein BOW53_14045 [Solemya pervernicosa gill symbiont]
MFKTNYKLATLAATFSMLLLTGCNSGSSSGNSAAAGSMTLGITDAPVDGAESVIIEFTGVEIQPESGELISITYDAPRSIDLLALQGGLRDLLLDGESLPAGQYSWIRLMINAEADNIFDSYSGSRYFCGSVVRSRSQLRIGRRRRLSRTNRLRFAIHGGQRS